MEEWVEFNRKYAQMWPVITQKKDPLPGYEERDGQRVRVAVDRQRDHAITLAAVSAGRRTGSA